MSYWDKIIKPIKSVVKESSTKPAVKKQSTNKPKYDPTILYGGPPVSHMERGINGEYIEVDEKGKLTVVRNEGTITSNAGTKEDAIRRKAAAQKEDEKRKAESRDRYNSRSEIYKIGAVPYQDPVTGEILTREFRAHSPSVIGMSGYDPLLGFAVDWTLGGKLFNTLGKGAMYGLGRWGTKWGATEGLGNWARGRIIGQELERGLNTFPLGQQALNQGFQYMTKPSLNTANMGFGNAAKSMATNPSYNFFDRIGLGHIWLNHNPKDMYKNTVEWLKERMPYNIRSYHQDMMNIANGKLSMDEYINRALKTRYKYDQPYHPGIKQSYSPYVFPEDFGRNNFRVLFDGSWRRYNPLLLKGPYIGDRYIPSKAIAEKRPLNTNDLIPSPPKVDLGWFFGDQKVSITNLKSAPKNDWTNDLEYKDKMWKLIMNDVNSNGPLSSFLKRNNLTPQLALDRMISTRQLWENTNILEKDKIKLITGFSKQLSKGELAFIGKQLSGIDYKLLTPKLQSDLIYNIIKSNKLISDHFYTHVEKSIYNGPKAFAANGYMYITPLADGLIALHELSHLFDISPRYRNLHIGGSGTTLAPYSDSLLFNKAFSQNGIPDHAYIYFTGLDRGMNATEMAARASLLKSYFGKDKLTVDDLRYAMKNYTKTEVDNNMTDFFNTINDLSAATQWINTHGKVIAPIAVGATTLSTLNNN